MRKEALLAGLRRHLEDELAAIESSQKVTAAGATHAEAKPENSKDTRALEQTYLARGLAARVVEMTAQIGALQRLSLRAFDEATPIALTALVTLEDDDGVETRYFLAPAGGGVKLEHEGMLVRVVTPDAPLARAVIGRCVGDDAAIGAGDRKRVLAITAVA